MTTANSIPVTVTEDRRVRVSYNPPRTEVVFGKLIPIHTFTFDSAYTLLREAGITPLAGQRYLVTIERLPND